MREEHGGWKWRSGGRGVDVDNFLYPLSTCLYISISPLLHIIPNIMFFLSTHRLYISSYLLPSHSYLSSSYVVYICFLILRVVFVSLFSFSVFMTFWYIWLSSALYFA